MQQHKKILPLLFLFLLLSVFATSLIPQVNATTTYEWIQNPSFEGGGGNLIANSGFEDGWDYWIHAEAQLVSEAHNGVKAVDLYQCGGYIYYNFSSISSVKNSSLINQFYLYAKQGSNYLNPLVVSVFYNDSSSQGGGQTNIVSGGYSLYNFSSLIVPAKWISSILIQEFTGSDIHTLLIDDVYMGIIGTGQTTVTSTTSPWCDNDYEDDDIFQGIAIGTAHDGIASYYAGYTDYSLIQWINCLDSNAIANISLWSRPVINGSIRVYLGYSDGLNSYKDVSSGTIGVWNLLNFSGFILPNKIVVSFVVRIINLPLGYTGLDDISLLATVPYNQALFSFTLSPAPLAQTNFSFTAYQRSGYVLTGYVTGLNGSIQGLGTFSVTSTTGTQTGTITDGVFHFAISARTGVTTFYEDFFIDIIMTTGNFTSNTFTARVRATWNYVSTEPLPTPPPEDYDSWYSNMVVTYMVLFIFLIVPPLIIAFEFAKHDVDPFMGFIGGLCLTVPIAYIVNIIDLWVLFVFVLGLILMILAKLGAFNRG